MDIVAHNRQAWTKEVIQGNKWTVPVAPEQIEEVKKGNYRLLLTPTRPVPEEWIGDIAGKRVLCLAAGGGQQGPIFSALGAVTAVLDICPEQLERDENVAKRDGLNIMLEEGDMRDLSRFSDEAFDMVFNPVSNCFIDDIDAVWRECFRVLKKGGTLLAGFCNPLLYIFDFDEWAKGNLILAHTIPYSDIGQLSEEVLRQRIADMDTLDFGHSIESQIGGQIKAGFLISGFYEDNGGGDSLLDPFINTFMATRAVKPI